MRNLSLILQSALVLSACSGVPSDFITPEAALHTRALGRAHAHNDYEHERPLFDALSHGSASRWTFMSCPASSTLPTTLRVSALSGRCAHSTQTCSESTSGQPAARSTATAPS